MKLSIDNKFFSFMSKLGDLIYLNILFIIGCIPIITIGASTCALYICIKKIMSDEESYLTKDFFVSFKENFNNSTKILLIIAIFCIPLYLFTVFFVNTLGNLIVMCLYVLVLICFTFTLLYIFPLQCTFVNTPFNFIKNAFLTSIRHLPYTLLLFLTVITPIVVTILMPQIFYFSFVYWVVIGFSISSLCSMIITTKVFEDYIK